MTGRQLPASDYVALKAATRRLLTMVGGVVAAAAVTRGDHQNLSRYGSAMPDHAERFMPVDVLADLESECERPILTEALAQLSGHMLVPVPRVTPSGTMLARVTAAALKETSDVFVRLAEGLGDGTLSAEDVARVLPEIDEAVQKLFALKFQVQAEVAE